MRKATQPKGLIYKLKKLEKRLVRSLHNGAFKQLNQHKQQQLFRRLQNYVARLRQQVKPALFTALLALGLGTAAQGQAVFTERTGTDNPLNSINESYTVIPTFVDIDNDGDMDCFTGQYGAGTITYYRNNGTASAASFGIQTSHPLDSVDFGSTGTLPAFGDIDGDSDLDVVIGKSDGTIAYYENTGTVSTATFTARTGTANPFNGIDVGTMAAAGIVDIDNDGDFDVFFGQSGNANNGVLYYENTGNSTFLDQSGASTNPLNTISTSGSTAPAFVDIDGDNDFDVFIGLGDGTVTYYINNGSVSNPSFSMIASAQNPLDGEDVGFEAYPQFVDIDNDGDYDAFIGEYNGNINFYENEDIASSTTSLPVVKQSLGIYPNPSSNGTFYFTASLSGKITIHNQLGQNVFTGQLTNSNYLDLSALPVGSYWLQYQDVDAKLSQLKLIIY